MNKLRKRWSPVASVHNPSKASTAPRSISRTLSHALTVSDDVTYTYADLHPRTSVEQYWAARALTAEKLLYGIHSKEVKHSVSL